MERRTAFEFGVAFGQFSARPNQDTYSALLNVLPAGMRGKFPAIDGVRKKLWWDLDPVSAFGDEWTADGCYQIGLLAYLRFILSLPGHSDLGKQAQDIKATEQRLRVEFTAQALPDDVCQVFIEGLSCANHDPNKALSEFVDKCERLIAEQTRRKPLPNPTVVNTTISGGQVVIATGANANVDQYMTMRGNKSELMAYLRSIGLDEEPLTRLGQAIDKDGNPQEDEVGAHVRKWKESLLQKATDGSWKVGINTASRLITEAILRYYGWE